MNEISHRSIIRFKAALGEFDDQSAQSEGALPDPPRQKHRVLAGNRLGFVPAHLGWRCAASLLNPPHQLITVLGATPKRAANSCRDSPSFKTVATARSRRSIE